VDVDAVHERAADLLLIAGDGHSGTTALFRRIAVITTGADVRVAVVVGLISLCYMFATSSKSRANSLLFKKTLKVEWPEISGNVVVAVLHYGPQIDLLLVPRHVVMSG
jgi:hypothetical protein